LPTLDDPRQEKYAQLVAAGESQSKAYVAAGYKDSNSAAVCASKLAHRPHVEARVKEITDNAARVAGRKLGIKKADVIQMLLDDREAARTRNQYGPAVRATELIGKELGMFVDRQRIETGPLDEAEIEELDAIAEQVIAEAARRAVGQSPAHETRAETRDIVPGDGAALMAELPEAL
jgi:hypothetical protein